MTNKILIKMAEDKKTRLIAIDYVLAKTREQKKYKEFIDYVNSEGEVSLSEGQIVSILNKMEKDGNIDFVGSMGQILTGQSAHDGVEIKINYTGELWLEKGGYTQEDINFQNLEKIKLSRDLLVRRQFRVNVLIAFWTGIAALYYLLEILKNFRSCCHH